MTANRVQPWLDDGDVTLYHGDSLDVLRTLPAGIAQTCVTSPPYWGLRDYGTGQWTGGDAECDHLVREDARIESSTLGGGKATTGHQREGFKDACPRCGARRVDSQLGLEATPDEYVENMVALFREVRRVLRDDGTLWLNLGDSYASHPKGNTKPRSEQGNGAGRYKLDSGQSQAHWQETTGFRPRVPGMKEKDLVGIPWRVAFALQADGWYLRSDIIWAKPNPMPESVTDRPTKAHEYVFLFSKQPRYYMDMDAIREPSLDPADDLRRINGDRSKRYSQEAQEQRRAGAFTGGEKSTVAAGRNRRSVWTIPTEPFPEAHFATYPQLLVAPCILAGSKPGDLCLDPFVGSGTTCLVARKHGRRCIGIDLSAEYLAIAAKRTSQLSLLGGFA